MVRRPAPSIVTLRRPKRDALLALARELGVPAAVIGRTGGPRLRLAVGGAPAIDCSVSEAEHVWATALERYFAGRAA